MNQDKLIAEWMNRLRVDLSRCLIEELKKVDLTRLLRMTQIGAAAAEKPAEDPPEPRPETELHQPRHREPDICATEGCDRPARARGLCTMHYQREQKAAIRWVWERGRGIFSEAGLLLYLEGFITDITDRKRAEEERLEMERRLQHTQRLESLGLLAGGIAHDFNNLLQIILGKAFFAKEACIDNQDALGFLSDIDVVVKRASTLIKQMLAYAGKGKYRTEPIDLHSLCTETSQLMKASISKKANLYFELTPDLKIEADISQLTQVLMNLITNASEAIGDNEGDIRIRTNIVLLDGPNALAFSPSDQLPAGSYARIEVSDTGCGMDEVTLVKIFDPFFTTKFTGRGLGLSAVQGIVRSHKGALRVESQPGKGTTFTILVPVSEGIPKAEAMGAPAATPQKGFRGTVLVVDDEEMVRGLLKRRFERLGVRVMEAENGQEALDIYRQHDKEISLVLLDYKMPKLDGIETFVELKKLNPDAKAILSSGYGEEDAIKSHGPRGWSGFIQKPYDLEEMVAKVQSLLNEGPTDSQAR